VIDPSGVGGDTLRLARQLVTFTLAMEDGRITVDEMHDLLSNQVLLRQIAALGESLSRQQVMEIIDAHRVVEFLGREP